jgi:uroporphyrinogen-III synthase
LKSALEAEGATVIACPTIETVPPDSWTEADDAVATIGDFDWIAFNSVNAVRAFAGRLASTSTPWPRTQKIAAVGRKTEDALTELGVRVDLLPSDFTAESLAAALGRGPGHILVPRAANASPVFAESLRAAGWDVVEVPVYRTVSLPPPAPIAAQVEDGFEAVLFASGSSVRSFVEVLPQSAERLRDGGDGPAVVCIGPETERTARELGLKVDAVAEVHTSEGLIAALSGLFGDEDVSEKVGR